MSHPVHSAVPVISTADIQKSLTYYIDVLGFSPDFQYGEPPVYAGVKSGDTELYFTHDPGMTKAIEEAGLTPEIFLWVTDANSLYQQHINNGAAIIDAIGDRPWGARQYVVKEINGYHLKFAQPL